jgi:hypothetical protein
VEQQRIFEDLPEVYRTLFPAFFEQLIPQETMATCNDCAMCAKPEQPRIPGQEYFQPDIKCCAFHPKLPNYLVGGLLMDTNPAMDHGRKVVREKIRARTGVSPSNIMPPKKYAVLHKYGGERSFGKNHSLLCPYYVRETGLCGVWKFRDAVCSTYFCKSVAGQEGKKFWNVLRGYLIQAQDSLTWYALLQLNWEVESVWDYLTNYSSDSLEFRDIDDLPPDEEAYKKIWGSWFGREEELYKKAYEIVSGMSREEYDRIAGMNQKVFLEWLKKRYQDVVAPVIPPMLRQNPDMKAFPAADGSYVIKTEAGFFTIQQALYQVITFFDGQRSLDDVKKLVQQTWDAELEDELLLGMFHNRMILPA